MLDGEARIYHLPGAAGELGFISSVSLPFCASCTRARLTADGRLRLCLLREKEVDLLTPLRQGATLEDLRQIILDGIWQQALGPRAGRRCCSAQPDDERDWGINGLRGLFVPRISCRNRVFHRAVLRQAQVAFRFLQVIEKPVTGQSQ